MLVLSFNFNKCLQNTCFTTAFINLQYTYITCSKQGSIYPVKITGVFLQIVDAFLTIITAALAKQRTYFRRRRSGVKTTAHVLADAASDVHLWPPPISRHSESTNDRNCSEMRKGSCRIRPESLITPDCALGLMGGRTAINSLFIGEAGVSRSIRSGKAYWSRCKWYE